MLAELSFSKNSCKLSRKLVLLFSRAPPRGQEEEHDRGAVVEEALPLDEVRQLLGRVQQLQGADDLRTAPRHTLTALLASSVADQQ